MADVEAFFEGKDAGALGRRLASNSVTGMDLLQFTPSLLERDLNMNAFSSRKVCLVRDAFLAGQ